MMLKEASLQSIARLRNALFQSEGPCLHMDQRESSNWGQCNKQEKYKFLHATLPIRGKVIPAACHTLEIQYGNFSSLGIKSITIQPTPI